jgi:hypothetical protein
MSKNDFAWLTPEIESAQAHHRERIAALYAGCLDGPAIAIDGATYGHSHHLGGTNEIDMLARPAAWLDEVLDDMAAHACAAADRDTFRPLAIELDPHGVHYIDALFGAEVYFHAGQVWSRELAMDLESLDVPDVRHSPVFLASIRLAQMAVQRARGRLMITNPVLSCPTNIAINLFGERFLAALAERPDVARHVLRIVTDVIETCTLAFMQVIPADVRRNSVVANRYAPPGYGQIDGCATQLISGRHYRGYFAQHDHEILAVTPHGGMIHLCGSHTQHIPTWRDMPLLKSFQLNDRATDDLEHFARGLRPDQVLYVTPTEKTPPARILQLTHGRPVIIQAEKTW